MFKLLCKSSCSLCFEWENELCYYTDREYTVIVNGKKQFTSDTNVFSVFNLLPDTEYTVEIENTEYFLTVKTDSESCCLNVGDFGVVADGVTDNTVNLQTAINCLPKNGRLYFGKGVYLSGPLFLKSNITLNLDEGAVILGLPDKEKFPTVPGELEDMVTHEKVQVGTWEGNPTPMRQAMLFGEHLENIRIVGKGVIDGNSEAAKWWENFRGVLPARPRLVFLNSCKNVLFHGITGQNAASWQFQPFFSENVDFIDIKVFAPKNSHNTDAIDPESCNRVNIIGCVLSVGDDCIAIKSGKIYMGKKYKRPADNHTVRNCLMKDGHGAITLGSEIAGGVKNLTVNRCVFNSTDRGLRIKTRRGRGKDCVVDNVVFENIKMDSVLTPIVINMWYYCGVPDELVEFDATRAEMAADARTPYLGEFHFKNMECKNTHIAACFCDGLAEQPIKKVTLENISFTYAENASSAKPAMQVNAIILKKGGMYFKNVDEVVLKNVAIDGFEGEKTVFENVHSLISDIK